MSRHLITTAEQLRAVPVGTTMKMTRLDEASGLVVKIGERLYASPADPAEESTAGWSHYDEDEVTGNLFEGEDEPRGWFPLEVDEIPEPEQPSGRSYCIGIPLAVTVHEDRVEFDVDLCEVGDIDEDDDAFGRYGTQVAVDRLTVSAAASKVGNHFNFTIPTNA